jgi:glucokinase
VTTVVAAPLLVGDLGGTHVRLALHGEDGSRRTRVHRWTETPSLMEAVTEILTGSGASAGCFAVAAPVEGTRVSLTNAGVAFCAEELRVALGLDVLHVVNDVAALARSVTDLRDDDAAELGSGPLRRDRTVVVVAPGTGLGVAGLVPTSHGPLVVPGEGGQIPLPATALGLPAAQALLQRDGHVSAEDLVCGRGLPVLDVVLRALRGEISPRARSAAAVTGSGDPGVLEVFVDLLAAVAQSHALTFGARGGVVLSGGFLRDLVPLLRAHGLRERFVRHPKMAAYLSDVPLVVDTREHPALLGAARFLEDLS